MKTKDISYTYNKRTWLNPLSSSSTSSVVCFNGTVIDQYGKYIDTFLQIRDCSRLIKLHKKFDETDEEFITKLELLKNEIDLFIKHLKQ